MVVTTLDQMARGGIRDHLAGGYHRYATDRSWTVPHFEKMLYDNAQLAAAHLLAFELTGDVRWRHEAEATFAFLARTMTAPGGGFFSALDAESGRRGGPVVRLDPRRGRAALGAGADHDVFAAVYGLTLAAQLRRGPLRPPRAPQPRRPGRGAGDHARALETRLAPLRARLLAVRDRRPMPLRDDKVLTSWNGLMIAAYAEGFRVLQDAAYRQAAERAADFLLTGLRTARRPPAANLPGGQAKIPAYLEDYAFLAHGLLRLHAATGDPTRLDQARALTDRMIADFADTGKGASSPRPSDHESLLARPKDPFDGALPSGNSVAIRNLVALAAATGEGRCLDLAGQALDAFSATLAESPGALPLMLVALEEYLDARPAAAVRRPGGRAAGRPDRHRGDGRAGHRASSSREASST